MKVSTALLSTALFLALPTLAAEEPEAVYAKFHAAVMAGNLDDLNRYGTPGGGAELMKLPADQKKAVLELMRKFLPPSYTVTVREFNADGTVATLTANGMGASLLGGAPKMQYGSILMRKMNGDWKVDEAKWSDQQGGKPPPIPVQAGPSPVPQANAVPAGTGAVPMPAESKGKLRTITAPPPAPDRKLGQAKPCEFKPVMTDEDLARCR